MTELLAVMDVLKRLSGALLFLKLAEQAIPRLVEEGRTSSADANIILSQIPALRDDIQRELKHAKATMETIQDRVEVIAQFMLLHQAGLSSVQAGELQRLLAEVRG